MASKKWIPSNLKEGAFTAKAKAAGMSVQAYAHHVLREGSTADETTKRQARLAITFNSMAKKKK